MRVNLITGTARPALEEFRQRLVSSLADKGVVTEEGPEADMVLAVGGDGTMLGAVKQAVEWDVPVLGFNLGTLGFLTEADPDNLDDVVSRLVEGNYEIDRRMTLTTSTPSGSANGVNDVVVEKLDSTRLITLAVSIDGDPFAKYSADGVIVATPTGSTGYSFSAGGPIVDPSLDAFILTPVAAHSLFDRPLVVPSERSVEIQVVRDRPVRVYVDKTDLGHLTEGQSITVRRGERDAQFVTFGSRTYPTLVRDKFGLS